MKKLFLISLIFLLVGCVEMPEMIDKNNIGVTNPLDALSLAQKFSQADDKITKEYILEQTSLLKPAKDENSIAVRVGEENVDEFAPNFKISRWEDEVSFKLKPCIDGVLKKDKDIEFEDKKIKFKTPKVEYHFYELDPTEQLTEGGYEVEMILNEKPDSNVIIMDIETENLNFYYQPPLDEELKNDECWTNECTPTDCCNSYRPENAVGSYAVYHATKANHRIGDKNYMAGKAFHIYRPKLIDSNGWEIWGELNIDIENKIQTVTIPQDFLDNAVYPIKRAIGEIFGYNSTSVSTYSYSPNVAGGTSFTITENGDVDDIKAYIKDAAGYNQSYIKGLVFNNDASKTLVSNGVGSAAGTVGSSAAWYTSTFATSPSLTGDTAYVLGIVWSYYSVEDYKFYYDSETGYTSYLDLTNSYTTPATMGSPSTQNNWRYCIYADYTPTGAGDTCTYSGSGDWYINADDNCYITADTYVTGIIHLQNVEGPGALYVIDGITLSYEDIDSTSTPMYVEGDDGTIIKQWTAQ